MHLTGKTYGKKPSDLLGLKTEWGAWQFDELCAIVGLWVEGNLAQGKAMFDGLEASNPISAKQKYAPVASGNIKRVKINPNGTW